MKAMVWIAIEAMVEGAPRGAWSRVVWVLLIVVTPFQIGLTDGPASRLPIWSDTGGMRGSLLMFGLWPAVAAAGWCVDVIVARRLSGGMEPILASPVTSFQIVAGHALPVLAVSLVAPIVTFPAARLGYGLLAPAPPPDAGGEFVRACLATWAAGSWMAAAMVDAALRARDSASLAGRTFLLGCLPLVPCDLACAALAVAGLKSIVPVAMVATGAAGCALLVRVGRRLDREALLRRP